MITGKRSQLGTRTSLLTLSCLWPKIFREILILSEFINLFLIWERAGGAFQVSVYFVSFFLAFFFFWQKYINEQIPIAYLSKKNYNANLNSHSKSKHGYPIQVSEFTQHIICSSYEERNTRNWTGMRGNPTLKGIKLMVQGLELFDWDLIFLNLSSCPSTCFRLSQVRSFLLLIWSLLSLSLPPSLSCTFHVWVLRLL